MPESLSSVDYQWPRSGLSGAKIALVGEAPGADEVREGRPFVGKAGRLLDRALQASGIDRETCLIANVFRIRPPDNKLGHFFASRRRAALEGEALAERFGKLGAEFCKDRYAGEIDALGAALRQFAPAIIVALGRAPLWALTGLNGISAMRGQVLPCRLAPASVIATFHPSYVARQNSIGPETDALFRADLSAARDQAALASDSSSAGMGAPG